MSNLLLALVGLALAAPPPGSDYSVGSGHVRETDFVGSGYSGPNARTTGRRWSPSVARRVDAL